MGKSVSSKELLPPVFNINKGLKGFRDKVDEFLVNLIFVRDGLLFQIFAP